MVESFPRQQARTRRFTLGVPRAFRVSPDGQRVAFLRTRDGSNPLTCLWVLDVPTGTERLVADPATLGGADDQPPPEEQARRERVRESADGIVSYATDRDVRIAVFALAGRVYVADLTGDGAPPPGRQAGTVTEVAARSPALDPRPDPAGRRVAYVSGGALRVVDLPASGQVEDNAASVDRVIADPGGAGRVTFGLAEFVAAEEMGRTRGHWWAPDGEGLLVAKVDETQVPRWHVADPADPGRAPREIAYPAAGTCNADVSLVLAGLDGRHTPVAWDRAAFPYLVTVCWTPAAAGFDEITANAAATFASGRAGRARPAAATAVRPAPLIVVQSRDQRRMRLLAVDPDTGRTAVLREDADPHWVDIVPGVPAWTADGRIVWTVDVDDTRRLVVAAPAALAAGAVDPVTPPGLHVRRVLDVDGETVLFTASAEPTETDLWCHGPGGVTRLCPPGGVHDGWRAGGVTVVTHRSLDTDGVDVAVLRDLPDGGRTRVATIRSRAERPVLPPPRPRLSTLGPRRLWTAVLLPSWHRPGSGRLPVLLDPYGGPHAQRVVAARDAYLTSQWFAEQGFAVLVADGRGTPGRGPAWERAVAGDLAGPVLDDQIDALHAAAATVDDLDLSRVGIRGWSFGGYLAALAVLRRPDVFHAAVAGAPVTDWRLYDTHYTERYLGHPNAASEAYRRCSLVDEAARARRADARPLLLVHGLADDNVVVAHTLRLSSALLAAGYPHAVLPLTGVTHMTPQEVVAENLLLLQLDFLRRALGAARP